MAYLKNEDRGWRNINRGVSDEREGKKATGQLRH